MGVGVDEGAEVVVCICAGVREGECGVVNGADVEEIQDDRMRASQIKGNRIIISCLIADL